MTNKNLENKGIKETETSETSAMEQLTPNDKQSTSKRKEPEDKENQMTA